MLSVQHKIPQSLLTIKTKSGELHALYMVNDGPLFKCYMNIVPNDAGGPHHKQTWYMNRDYYKE